MSKPADITYPAAAKKTTWNAAQTAGDKIDPRTTKTGLGKALEAAEAAWGKIPLATFDVKNATNLTEAKKAKTDAAQALLAQVAAAKKAVDDAHTKAGTVKAIKSLSTGAKTAATNAETALHGLQGRFASFSTADLDKLASQLQKAADTRSVIKLSITVNGKQVVSNGAATWNHKTLKFASNTVGAYIGQKARASGRYSDNDDEHFDAELVVKTATELKNP